MTNRIALAPIKDTALNATSPLKNSKHTWLPEKRATTLSAFTSTPHFVSVPSGPECTVTSNSSAATSTETPKKATPSLAQTQTIPLSTQTSLLLSTRQESPVRLAALQLRIKLRLAIHKLQHSQKSRSPISVKKSATRLSSTRRRSRTTNVNLTLYREGSSEASSAADGAPQTGKNASLLRNLRLFKVKPLLAAHILSPIQLPLTKAHEAASRQASLLRQNLISSLSSTPQFSGTSYGSRAQENKPGRLGVSSFRSTSDTDVFRNSVHKDHENIESNMRYALPLISLASSARPQSHQSLSLPSINKILHTPMKATYARSLYSFDSRTNHTATGSGVRLGLDSSDSSKRTCISEESSAAKRQQCLPNATTGIDDTIDEDSNRSQTSFCNTLDVTPASKTRHVRPYDQCRGLTDSSSPLHQFGTPNSFSVAKSLLQLSGHGV